MLSKKIIITSVFALSLLTGCASVLNDINNVITGNSSDTGSTPTPNTSSIKTGQSSQYKINTYMRHAISYTLDDHIKVWGKPAEVYKSSNDYLAKWTPFSDKNCVVYVNFNPRTLQSKPMDYYLDRCEDVTMTGPVIEVPKNEVYSAGYMKTRNLTLADMMEKWIGRNVDSALIKWGSPFSSVQLNAGGRIYTWKTYWETRRNVWSGEYTYGYCEQSLITNSKGIVSNWNYSNCRGDTYGKIPAIVPVPKPREN